MCSRKIKIRFVLLNGYNELDIVSGLHGIQILFILSLVEQSAENWGAVQITRPHPGRAKKPFSQSRLVNFHYRQLYVLIRYFSEVCIIK